MALALTYDSPSVTGRTLAPLKISAVAVTVTSGTASGASSADTSLVGGTIIGWVPASPSSSTYQVYSIVLGATGAITITCIGNVATNDAIINVLVARLG